MGLWKKAKKKIKRARMKGKTTVHMPSWGALAVLWDLKSAPGGRRPMDDFDVQNIQELTQQDLVRTEFDLSDPNKRFVRITDLGLFAAKTWPS